jgi:hypothetical protein
MRKPNRLLTVLIAAYLAIGVVDLLMRRGG